MRQRGIEFADGFRPLETIQSYRAWRQCETEIRDRPSLSGYVVKFMERSHCPILNHADGIKAFEQILPGAFAASLNGGDNIKALLLHDDQWELGQRDDYSLKLLEDAEGLRYHLHFDHETRIGRLLYGFAELGRVAGLSFRFTPRGRNGLLYSGGTRVLANVHLSEISFFVPPHQPAYRSGTVRLDVPISALRKRLDALVGTAR